MVYDTQNYWVSGLCPSSGIKKLECDVLETASVSMLRLREEDSCSVGSLRKRSSD
jgi:hypothetical protein